MSHAIWMSLSSLLSLTTSILAFSGLLSICHVLIPMEFPIFFILHREHKHAWKGEYLGSEVFLFWTYARCWLGVILLKICSNFKILCLVSDRTWWHQVQVSLVCLYMLMTRQFLVQITCLCSMMKFIKWMQQESGGVKYWHKHLIIWIVFLYILPVQNPLFIWLNYW